ncbi:MAG: class I SAM-dependent methyltransferase [Oscillospiraceae bacterium]|nr:class I SAM-dependent methyltransferase [Oscillospiraceae bacterium]
MSKESEYAVQWFSSAEFFFEKGYYRWMCEKIKDYETVLEIGCGTGHSTLALLQSGHKVIAIDKNPECLLAAKKLIENNSVDTSNVIFLQGDIADHVFRECTLTEYSFDVVVCWNVGTAWKIGTLNQYMPYFAEYGLTRGQVLANPESSYGELILWNACRIANEKKVPIQIVERGTQVINKHNDQYYCKLKEEFNYSSISYKHHYGESLSKGGRMLSIKGTPHETEKISIVFLSIIFR